LLIDGVRYRRWVPFNEADLERLVRQHASDIFGDSALYLRLSAGLRGRSAVAAIPDGYLIRLDTIPVSWHIVMVEISTHPLFEHMVSQLSEFMSALGSPQRRAVIADCLAQQIGGDERMLQQCCRVFKSSEIGDAIAEVLSREPGLYVIAEAYSAELNRVMQAVPCQQKVVVPFQTYVRDGVGLAVHASLFEPQYPLAESPPPGGGGATVELTISAPECLKSHFFYIPRAQKHLFPGYRVSFELETDAGNITTWVSSIYTPTAAGERDGDVYVQRNLARWFKAHPELSVGSRLFIEILEPMKRYRLSI